MLGKKVSPEIMRFAVVFIILFRISFGFHLHFGLDQIFRGLTGGKSGLFNFGKYHDSKQANQTHDSSFSKDSKKGSGSSEDPLKSIVETAGAVLNGSIGTDSLKTVAGTVGKAEKILEGSLETVAKTAGKAEGIVESTLETVAKKSGKAEGIVEGTLGTTAKKTGKEEKIVEGTLGTVSKTAGEVLKGGNLKGSLKTVVGTVNKTISGSTVTDNLKTVSKTAGGSVRGVENTLGAATGLVSKSVGGGSSEKHSEVIVETADETVGGSIGLATSEIVGEKAGKAKTGGTLDKSLEIVTSKAGGVVPALEGTLKTVSGKTGEAVSTSVVESSSGVVSGKAGKSKTSDSLDKSLEIVTSKAGGAVRTSGVSMETVSGRIGGAVSSSIAESSSGIVDGKVGGAVRTLGGSLETVSGSSGGAESNSFVESSSGLVTGKVGKVAGDKVSAGGAAHTIEGTLETVPGSTGGDVSSIVGKSSSGSVDGKIDRVISESVSLGTVTGKEVEYDVSEDYLEINPKNVRETIGSRVASVSGGGERGLNEEIQKVPRDISNKSAANSLQTVITDVSVGEVCSSKSVVTGFPSYPPVSKFVHIFIQGVEASELLTKLFNITGTTALRLSQFKYRYIADVFRKLGFIDASDIAAASVRHIAKYFDVIAPEVLVRVYANAFANYIFAEGFLTNENAEQHAQNYIKTMLESAEGNGVICECDYNRNFQALGDGVLSFLLSVGEPSHTQAWGTAFYFAHEWLLAAVDYGSLRDLTVKK